jgi:hypothetical protein
VYAFGVQALAIRQFEQRQQDVTTNLRGTGSTRDAKAIATAGDFDIQATFDLPEVFVKLATQIRQAVVIGGLEDNVPKNPDCVQSL